MWQHRRLIAAISLGSALLTGVYPLQYEWGKKRRAPFTLYMRVYTLLHNILIILLTVPEHFLYSIDKYSGQRSYPLFDYVNATCILVRIIAVVAALVLRWTNEWRLHKLIKELNYMERNYFEKLKIALNHKQLNSLLYLKLFTFAIGAIYAIGRITHLIWVKRTFDIEFSFVILNMLNLLHVVAFSHFIVLWHLCSLFYLLGEQLAFILQAARVWSGKKLYLYKKSLQRTRTCKKLAMELCNVAVVYAKIVSLLNRLNGIFKYQLLTVMLSYFVNYVAMGYYTAMVFGVNFTTLTLIGFILSCIMYTAMYLNIIIFLNLAYRVTCVPSEMSQILRQFGELPSLHRLFDRSCEMLALQLLVPKVVINVFGLFNINRRAAFAVMVQVTLYIIFLVQKDYKNLYYELKVKL